MDASGPGGTGWWIALYRLVERSVPRPETLPLLDKIKPSAWNEMKTDGINFSEKFIWLDDDLWQDELKVLERHNAIDNFILIDLQKDPDQLKTIADLL